VVVIADACDTVQIESPRPCVARSIAVGRTAGRRGPWQSGWWVRVPLLGREGVTALSAACMARPRCSTGQLIVRFGLISLFVSR